MQPARTTEYAARKATGWAVAAGALALAAAWLVAPVGVKAADDAANPTLRPPIEWLPEPALVENADAATAADMKPYAEVMPGTKITIEMVPIPGGTFTMGSPAGEAGRDKSEGPQFQVEVEPFWMGKLEVTWDQYDLWLMGIDKQRRKQAAGDPSKWDLLADAITQPTPPYIDLTFGMGREGKPAISMTQFAAKIYCKWLGAKTGRYYRLPSEAEWEYACRAGTTTAYSFGDDPAQLGDYAWTYANSNDSIHEVGKKKPNPWGLYDMHGNAAEWVLDKFTPDGYSVASGSTVKDPVVIPDRLYPRVVRGGCYADDAPQVRSAARRGSTIAWMANDPQIPQSIWHHTDAWGIGFRVMRPFRLPTAEEMPKYDVDPEQVKAYSTYPKTRGAHG